MATAMKRALTLVTRVAGNKTRNGNGGKSDGNGNKVGGQVTTSRAIASATVTRGQWQWQQGWRVTNRAKARAARAIEMTMRVAGNKKGKGGKTMATTARVASKRTATATKRAMPMKTRLGGAGGGNYQPLHVTPQ